MCSGVWRPLPLVRRPQAYQALRAGWCGVKDEDGPLSESRGHWSRGSTRRELHVER